MTPSSKNAFQDPGCTPKPNRVDLRSSEGMSMIFLLIILAVSGVAMMGIMSMGNIQRRSQSQSMVPAQIVTIRGNIMNTLKNLNAWNNTANDPTNSTLNCYRIGHDCVGPSNTPTSGIVTKIYDAAGNIAFYADTMGGNTTNGYGVDGSACTTFPSEDCPIKFMVTWDCTPFPAGTANGCNSPGYTNIQISAEPVYKPIRLSTGQFSPDALVINTPGYLVGPVLRTTAATFFSFP